VSVVVVVVVPDAVCVREAVRVTVLLTVEVADTVCAAVAVVVGVSDTVLALDRFVPWAKHSAAPGLVMSTYFMGQGLISLSAKGAGGKPKTAGGSTRSAAKGKSAE
jgi:uncharacterized protein with von Willebrand factor type A (vWA) domain